MRRLLIPICILGALLPPSGLAQEIFEGLSVATETASASYERGDWKHWIAQPPYKDTRQRVLGDESLIRVKLDSDGRVVFGLWVCPYTGRIITDPGELQIDHLVPLKEVHESGGHAWNAERKEQYANDLMDRQTLIAVVSGANSSKRDKDPADWLPPNRASWCRYLRDWIAVKQRWELTIDTAERDTLETGLQVCEIYRIRDHILGRH